MSWSSAASRTARQSSSGTRLELAALLQARERAPGQVVGAERVLEAGVGGAGIDQEGVADLADVAQPLHGRRVEREQRRRDRGGCCPRGDRG